MNLEIILNVFIALFVYNIFIKAIAQTFITYFLNSSKTIQNEKKSFQEKLKEKMK